MTTVVRSLDAKDRPAATRNIRVYNTLSREKEPFQTVVPGRVGIYLCGPTVYKQAHIGHMVGPVIFDTIKRYLTYSGYQVIWVVNITDVDDKIIGESVRRQLSMAEIAEEMTADYLQNLRSLGVDQIDHLPKATEHIDGICQMIGELVRQGFAYEAEGDVYFEVSRDTSYGKLSNRTSESMQGEGGEMAGRKRAPGDFALWKKAKPGEPAWPSPWGQGRPGWHIECSAMSRALLGETFDIHGGGLDLVFPHHENEIAQSECCHGRAMVRYWLHNGLMRADPQAGKVGGRADRAVATDDGVSGKISRSKGDGGLAELVRTQTGERIRFFLLRTHYRSTIVYSLAGLQEAGAALDTFYRFFERYQRITGESFYALAPPQTWAASEASRTEQPADAPELIDAATRCRNAFLEKMDDDFNTGGAIAELFEMVRQLNLAVDRHRWEDAAHRTPAAIAAFRAAAMGLREMSQILGLFICPPQRESAAAGSALVGQLIEVLIELRNQARARKDFATSDQIRDALTKLNIVLEDHKGTTTWRLPG